MGTEGGSGNSNQAKLVRAPSRKRSSVTPIPGTPMPGKPPEVPDFVKTSAGPKIVYNVVPTQVEIEKSSIEVDFLSSSELIRTTSANLARKTSYHFDNLIQSDKKERGFFYFFTRFISLIIDILVFICYAEGGSLVSVAHGDCENDFLLYVINYLPTGDDKKAEWKTIFNTFSDDLRETTKLIILAAFMVLFTLCVAIIASRGQTIGMLLTGLSHAKEGKKGRLKVLNTVETLVRAVVGTACLPLCFLALFNEGKTLGDSMCGSIVVRTSMLTDTAGEEEEEKEKGELLQRKRIKQVENIALQPYSRISEKVNTSWSSRPWNDLFFLILFAVSSVGFYIYCQSISPVKEVSGGSILRYLFGDAPVFIGKNPDKAVILAFFSFVLFCVFGVLFQILAVPIFYIIVFGKLAVLCYVSFECIRKNEMEVGQILVVLTLTYCYWLYSRFYQLLLTVEVWKEGMSATIRHPLLGLSVVLLECVWQTYQLWMLSVLMGKMHSDASSFNNRHTFNNGFYLWWGFQQFISFATIKNVFEIAVAGTVSRYYFRQADDSDFLGMMRTSSSFLAACTKSLGSAVFGAFVLYIAEFFRISFEKFDKLNKDLPWIPFFPIKIVLILIKSALAAIYHYLIHLNGYCCSFVGMYGCSYSEAAGKSNRIFSDPFAQTLFLRDFSNTLNVFMLISMIIVNYFFTLPLLLLKLGINSTSDISSCSYIVGYMFLSFIWSLKGAARAVMVCMCEEVYSGVSTKNLRCGESLKAAVQKSKDA